ncbi:MAG TPA: hypothetical protein VGI22_28340 [Xanthobacteraceae bacterium]
MPGRNHERSLTVAITVMLMAMTAAAAASDEPKFPDWSGQWVRTYGGNPRYDQTKPIRKQEAPLKPEYQARFEASIADQNAGGHGLDRGYTCLPQGMPRMMSGVSRFEFLFKPEITYILFERTEFAPRRIYTDGRDWPKTEETWFTGYSIGKWLSSSGQSRSGDQGRYDTLEVETRRVRGPRTWDQSGIPMADDADGIIKERIALDPTDPDLLRVEMTTIDNSLTRPWTVLKVFKRQAKVWWSEDNCIEGQAHVTIGSQVYFLSGDGTIMPMKKDQPPPDLKYFNKK